MKHSPDLKARLVIIYSILAVLNIGGWGWALLAFHGNSVLLGVALMVYGLGLRHAVDADHIAAIDNVTRALMRENQRPVGVGFFFALGHSIIVIAVAAVVAVAANTLSRFESFKELGGAISTGVSATFLLAIATTNLVIFLSLFKTYRHVRAGGAYVEEDLDILLNGRGLLARILRPLFRLVTRSWHMIPLGFLFGLGFDTATEIALFGVAATQLVAGMSLATLLVFPLLFAAGMSLLDTTDGVLMLGAYDWAFVKPMRKLYYNLIITLLSVMVALFIGGIEAFGLIGARLELSGGFWDRVGGVGRNLNTLGFITIGIFVAVWTSSYLIYRFRKWGEFEGRPPNSVSG
jgi:high-affinity nickel-transport protein